MIENTTQSKHAAKPTAGLADAELARAAGGVQFSDMLIPSCSNSGHGSDSNGAVPLDQFSFNVSRIER